MDKVSVVMPVFNGSKYVERAIKSFLYQSWSNKELIIVDDSSTDETPKILGYYASAYPEILVFTNIKNQGVSFSRNVGIRKTSGKYITLLDSDDWIAPLKLETQVKHLERSPETGAVFTDSFLVYEEEDGRLQRTYSDFRSSRLFLPMMLCRNIISPAPASCMYKREYLYTVQYDETLNNAEDYDLNLRLAFNCHFNYISEPLYYYTRHATNASNRHREHLENERIIVNRLTEQQIRRAFAVENAGDEEIDYIRLLRGIFELKRNRFEDSIKWLLSIHSNNVSIRSSIHFYLGVNYYKVQAFEQSLYHLTHSELIEEKPETLNNIGVINLLLNKHLEEATRYFEGAIKVSPDYQDALHNLAQLFDGTQMRLRFTERELRKSLISYK